VWGRVVVLSLFYCLVVGLGYVVAVITEPATKQH
jgi:hypothetical protein